ncbi:adenylate kinase [Encephalitozoon cuniculi EcunIII-L]|nr:adenylate kinase [Encephalitozoon cuniculi EcunIII-L]
MKKSSKEATVIREMVNSGRLAPDEIVNELVLKKIRSMSKYILDGYPRRIEQAGMLGDDVDLVIFIDVDEDTCISRICGRNEGRDDDDEEVGRKRCMVYNKETAPVLEFYKRHGKLLTINGCASPGTVFEEIRRSIE